MNAGDKLLLLVDERESGVEILGRMLAEDGYRIEIVNDGQSAATRLSRGLRPDALIANLALPGVDGFTVAQIARSRTPGVGVVFVTEHPHLLDRRRAVMSPEPVVLAKPVDYSVLTRELSSLLQRTPNLKVMEVEDEHAA